MPSQRIRNEQALVMTINHLTRSYRRIVNRALAVHNLSDSQALPVMFISRLGNGLRPGVLAEQLGIEGPSLTRQLDQLQAAGLVERQEDPADRRAKILNLTPAGQDFAAMIEDLLTGLRGGMLAGISDEDLVTTLAVLRRFDEQAVAALDHPVAK